MLRLLQMGPSKVLTTFLIPIQSSWQLSLLELPPCRNTVTPSPNSSNMYTSTVQSGPASANAAPLNLLFPTCPFYIFFLFPPTTVPFSQMSFCASCLLSPQTLSEFFNGMLEVFEPGALNYSTFFRPTLLTLSASRNPILTPLPHSKYLDCLLCSDHTHSQSGILSSDTTHASGDVVIYIRQGLSFSEVSTSSLSLLDPYSM